jgi:NitT/TauT family transport system ATP-binding protein
VREMAGESYGEMEIQGVTHIYDPEGARFTALENCSFKIPRGKLTVLVGPSGCGKTTLVNILAGYVPPTEGTVTIDGNPVTGPGWDRLVIFQETALFPWMTTLGNATFGPMVQGKDPAEAERMAMALIEKVGLRGFEHKYPAQLSGGMQRRAELVRALINQPRVMLMDEPFRGLDAMTREIMQEHLLKLYEETKMTIFFITAELEEAIFLGDSVMVMSSRPGTIRETVEIDLPRPRSFEMMASEHYLELKKKIAGIIHEEATKAFKAGRVVAADLAAAAERVVEK